MESFVAELDQLAPGARVSGLRGGQPVTIVAVERHGSAGATVVFRDEENRVDQQMLFLGDEKGITLIDETTRWSFAADGKLFEIAAEAHRIRLAHLFDPMLAVHTSNVTPLPHQLAAVYEEMLGRQPLRYLLADDPGAGKTIMSGLLIRELLLRSDVHRCLVVAPASLAEQWQDELSEKFGLQFAIVGRPEIDASPTNNPFTEHDLVISRIDMLKQDDNMARLRAAEWDLVIVDEAHKMSATRFGGEVKYTARYHLGELLRDTTRHFLMLTATPHSGKDDDFQLFLALLDGDRFEGRSPAGAGAGDHSDIMRRLLKEELLDFDGRPLFPPREATTVNYELSPLEAELYEEVTRYVSEEMNRAERLAAQAGGDRRKTVVGFALTILQRRLASSPAAIHESLKRRQKRLTQKLEEAKQTERTASLQGFDGAFGNRPPASTIEDLEDDLDEGMEAESETFVDLATAAQTVEELGKEIESLARLAELAGRVRHSESDKKWEKLREVLDSPEMFESSGGRRKLVIFTEHRDTLDYLAEKMAGRLGRSEQIVQIHGGLRREERRRAQTAFVNDPDVLVLIATDAAGEGVNLQRAHLMVNYDLPWNPNRLEQRFGRIHRFGQTEVCHLWNLVAHETREGAVYQRLFEKLDEERTALGGKVFDVLGRMFTEVDLRELMLDAIRYNTTDEAREFMRRKIDAVWSHDALGQAIAERALDATTLTAHQLRDIKDAMEQAEARRMVPHYIERFFTRAFVEAGGTFTEREPHRYFLRNVPADLRRSDRISGRGEPVARSYERICFDKALINVDGKPPATLVAPGHPLLDALISTLLQRHRGVLDIGAMLVDDGQPYSNPRVMFAVEHEVVDGRETREGNKRVVSQRVGYIEVDSDGHAMNAGPAPYLDYRPLNDDEQERAHKLLTEPWVAEQLQERASDIAIEAVAQPHLAEVRTQRIPLATKTMAAVKARLTREIQYWDNRAVELEQQERAGKKPRLNSANARRKRDELEARLANRMGELEREQQIAARPPSIRAGALVIPASLLRGEDTEEIVAQARDRKRIEDIAMRHVMGVERAAGREVIDVSAKNVGWDVESRAAGLEGETRFIEVKGRRAGEDTVGLTANEQLAALNLRKNFYLWVVFVNGDRVVDEIIKRDPQEGDPRFAVKSITLSTRTLRESAASYDAEWEAKRL